MILAIEGLDGSGKTTVGKEVAGRLGARFISGFPEKMGSPSSEFLAGYNTQSRYLYYLAVNAHICEQYGDSQTWVVVDRFVASTHALHAEAKGSVVNKVAGADFDYKGLNVYLDVDELERLRRLHARGQPMDPFERRLESDSVFRERVEARFRSWPGIDVVQTTGLSVNEVATDICLRAGVRSDSAEAN
jgi:thymidylate kinase